MAKSSRFQQRLMACCGLLLIAGATRCATPDPHLKWVHQIKLQGNQHLDQQDILDGLALRKTGWWPGATKNYYQPEVLDLDIKRIETYYAAHGFFAARVRERTVLPRSDGRSVDILLTIEEGQSVQVAAVQITGLEQIPAALAAPLRSELELKTGPRFSYPAYERTKTDLLALLKSAGYYYAKVEGRIEVLQRRNQARILLAARPGPRVRFGQTNLMGLGTIPRHKILRLLRWQENELYEPEKVERTRLALNELRVFSLVEITLPDEPTAVAPITIRLEPEKLHELQMGGGVGIESKRQEGRLRLLWTQRNFLGGLRTFTVRLKPSYVVLPAIWDPVRNGPALDTDGKLVQPDFLSTRLDLFGLLGYELGIHEGYRFHGPRAQVGIERGFFEKVLKLGLSWNMKYIDFFDKVPEVFEAAATPLGLGFVDPFHLAWFEESIQLDLRDQVLTPNRGFFAALSFEQGFPYIGSEFTYLKLTPEVRGYLPLGTHRVVLALRCLLGYLAPRGDESSPVTQRYYLGGPTSHRGFSSGRLAPQSPTDHVPLGGNAAFLFSSDLRFRLFTLFNYWLGLNAFFDAGDAVDKLGTLAWSKLHLAVGGSLFYQTPLGAIRTGIGVRLNRLGEQEDDGRPNPDPGSRLAFFITIGYAF